MAARVTHAVKVRRRRLLVASLLYGAAAFAVIVHTWPLAPFPEPAGIGALGGLSLLFGLLMRRRAVLLTPALFPAGWAAAGIGWFGGIVVLAGAGPLAVTAAIAGAGLRGGMGRWAVRRALRREARGGRALTMRLRRRTVAVP